MGMLLAVVMESPSLPPAANVPPFAPDRRFMSWGAMLMAIGVTVRLAVLGLEAASYFRTAPSSDTWVLWAWNGADAAGDVLIGLGVLLVALALSRARRGAPLFLAGGLIIFFSLIASGVLNLVFLASALRGPLQWIVTLEFARAIAEIFFPVGLLVLFLGFLRPRYSLAPQRVPPL